MLNISIISAKRGVCVKGNQTWIREKRHVQNNLSGGTLNHRIPSRIIKNQYIPKMDQDVDVPESLDMPNDIFNSMRDKEIDKSSDSKPYLQSEPYRPDLTGSISHEAAYESEKPHKKKDNTTTENEFYQKVEHGKNRNGHKNPNKVRDVSNSGGQKPGRNFALYEIGNPNLWYTVHIQLFEKLSTPEGKTVWNDITKGEQARYLL